MRFEKEQIKAIAGDLFEGDNIKKNTKYQWVDIVGIPPRPENLKKSLYFTTHSNGEDGWDNGFDRRTIAPRVSQDKGWDLVVEAGDTTPHENSLIVSSLDSLALKLLESVKLETNPYVIGVTGSVGKTTTVAFLEHLIAGAGIDVKRFYSKRLTPLGVTCHYINRVDKDTSVVVMEYSAYLKDHVDTLSQLLPPNLAFLTNVYNTHLNPGSFSDRNEIFHSKIQIGQPRTTGYVNERILNELNEPQPAGWNNFRVEKCPFENKSLPPTLRTDEMYTVGKIVAENLGLSETHLKNAFETFLPQEKRIINTTFAGKKIFFNGETSGGSRLWSWFETTNVSPPWLFVDEVNFADENPLGFINLLKHVFDSEKTLVLDTPANRSRLPVKAHFVNANRFKTMLKQAPKGYIVYHKALSTRDPAFVPKTYLRDHWGP